MNQMSYSNLPSRSSMARQKLFDLQNHLQAHPLCSMTRELEKKALQEFLYVSKAEEGLFRQKSCLQWLAEGDQNTKFFHKVVQQRIKRNKLVSLTLEDGTSIRGHSKIAQEAITYFHSLLNADNSHYPGRGFLNQFINKSLTQA